MEVHRRLLNESVTYQERRALIENRALAYEEQTRSVARRGVLVIPVVVHVVYNPAEPAQNITREQIQGQIDTLNEDFRAKNTEIPDVPAVWTDRVADCNIEFRLASRDGGCNATDGITRTPSTMPFFSTHLDDVKTSATGGADPWPSDEYLNLWVCSDLRDRTGRTILGYAQFPGGSPRTDGVVIASFCFGTSGTAEAPFNLGRTATHEIGHWLDLRHIWGDDFGSCSGSDLVDDTPNQAEPTFGTPSFPQLSCNNGPNGNMFMNYLDYTDDAAMFMFTHGQSRRMDAALEGARASFLTSGAFGVTPPGETPAEPAPEPEPAPGPASALARTRERAAGDTGRLEEAVEQLHRDNEQIIAVLTGIRAALNGDTDNSAEG